MDSTSLTHAFASFGLFGLIWTIQLVHYPAFAFIEAAHWHHFHQKHSRNITLIVFPLMLIELLTAIQLIIEARTPSHLVFLACTTLTWTLTAAVFIPLHNSLSRHPEPQKIRRLINLNWTRTAIWTINTVAVFTAIFADKT
ncbi:MAG: hypothetical protein AAGC74_08940 [Verrucomicrobiota bacterium]